MLHNRKGTLSFLHAFPVVLPSFIKQKSTIIERPSPKRLLDLQSIDRALGAQRREGSSLSEKLMI